MSKCHLCCVHFRPNAGGPRRGDRASTNPVASVPSAHFLPLLVEFQNVLYFDAGVGCGLDGRLERGERRWINVGTGEVVREV